MEKYSIYLFLPGYDMILIIITLLIIVLKTFSFTQMYLFIYSFMHLFKHPFDLQHLHSFKIHQRMQLGALYAPFQFCAGISSNTKLKLFTIAFLSNPSLASKSDDPSFVKRLKHKFFISIRFDAVVALA